MKTVPSEEAKKVQSVLPEAKVESKEPSAAKVEAKVEEDPEGKEERKKTTEESKVEPKVDQPMEEGESEPAQPHKGCLDLQLSAEVIARLSIIFPHLPGEGC